MKIAFVNIYQGRIERGLETYISELAERLGKDHKVDILSAKSSAINRWPLLWRVYLDPHGIKIALFTLKLFPKIWKERYDVIFAQNGGWQPAFLRILTWLYGGKMIISGQSGKGWDDRNNLWCFPDRFVALTDEGYKWARKANPFVKIRKIPNGVDTLKFKPGGNKYKTSLTPPIVICQGAAEASKRLDLAIKAAARLSDVSLLLIGSGSLELSIKELGRKLMGERFEMIRVPHKDMPSVYRVGKVFTLPSMSTEAFGISYVEALSTNLAVVATDTSERREIVGDAGLFVDPENIAGYAKALSDALHTDWGDKPRRQAEKFSWDRVSKSYEDLLKDLAK